MSYDTEERLSTAMRRIVGDRPFAPDIRQIESRARQLRRHRLAVRVTAGSGFAIAAVAAVAVATSGAGTKAPASNLAAPKPGVASGATTTGGPLFQLVANLSAAPKPTGDATLLLRDQVFTDGKKIDVWDLHADNGDYYFAKTRNALPAQVAKGNKQPDAARRKNVVAAALFAVKGDPTEARKKMAWAYLSKTPKNPPAYLEPGVVPTLDAKTQKKLSLLHEKPVFVNGTDHDVWSNSMDALMVGGGNPAVRAGVLRLLGQIPEITVTKGAAKGQPVLILTAGTLATSGDTTETLTVDAGTGLPIKFHANGITINYGVTRVTLADVAKGKF